MVRGFEKGVAGMKTIKEKMLEANKARTDLLSDNPEINSKWTPDAVGIMEVSMKEKYGRAVMTVSEQMQEELEPLPEPLPDLSEEAEDEILKSTGKIDFTKDSEYIRLYGNKN